MRVTGYMVVFRWSGNGRTDAAGLYPGAAEARAFGESVGHVLAVKLVDVDYQVGDIPADAFPKPTTQIVR